MDGAFFALFYCSPSLLDNFLRIQLFKESIATQNYEILLPGQRVFTDLRVRADAVFYTSQFWLFGFNVAECSGHWEFTWIHSKGTNNYIILIPVSLLFFTKTSCLPAFSFLNLHLTLFSQFNHLGAINFAALLQNSSLLSWVSRFVVPAQRIHRLPRASTQDSSGVTQISNITIIANDQKNNGARSTTINLLLLLVQSFGGFDKLGLS